jgi:hypothetical protein
VQRIEHASFNYQDSKLLRGITNYLGLPALIGKSRVREFQSIKDRAWRRLNDWKSKFFSQAGKEMLLKVVIQAIPTYSMGVPITKSIV